MKQTTVLPAYGRDYTTAKAARADFDANKDFIVTNAFDPYDGKPVNKGQLTGYTVTLRYNGARKLLVIKL